MTFLELKEFLDEKADFYEQKKFIENDPIIIPHDFNNKLDIEISGFIISIISWGNRKSIINSGYKIITFLESSPYDFIINHSNQYPPYRNLILIKYHSTYSLLLKPHLDWAECFR